MPDFDHNSIPFATALLWLAIPNILLVVQYFIYEWRFDRLDAMHEEHHAAEMRALESNRDWHAAQLVELKAHLMALGWPGFCENTNTNED